MDCKKQVDKSHYEFSRYMIKPRWCSLWHQIDELKKISPENVLEVGNGTGLLKIIASTFNIFIETLDIDPDLKPDHVGSVLSMPFADGAYDAVCAFQVLEHLPYEESLNAFGEMVRVSRRYVIISLPDARPVWQYRIHLPKFGPYIFFVHRPLFIPRMHKFDGEHYWEINKKGYPISRILTDFSRKTRLINTYRAPDNLYHRFFLFER